MPLVQGIDVARYQPEVDWAKVKNAGITFVVAKASQGGFADQLFATHWAGAKAAGLLRGAYCFLDPRADGAKQADAYLKALGDDFGELPPVLDVEAKTEKPTELAKFAEDWLAIVEKATGKTACIYTAAWYWNSTMLLRGKYPEWATSRPLWVAGYPVGTGAPSLEDLEAGKYKPTQPKGWDKWTLWQYSEKGRVDGVNANGKPCNVDLNIYGATRAEFFTWLGIPDPNPVSFAAPGMEAPTEVALGSGFAPEAPMATPVKKKPAAKKAPAKKAPAKKAKAKKPAAKKPAKKPAKKAAKKPAKKARK